MYNNSEFLGSGLSREVFLLEDGTVLKLARFQKGDDFGGHPDRNLLSELLVKFKDNSTVKKINRLLEKGCKIGTNESGTIAEFLVSLELTQNHPESTEFFALCTELKVRKENNKNNITVKGIFEFANEKPRPWGEFDDYDFHKKTGILIEDLHDGNYENNIIVDYACIRY